MDHVVYLDAKAAELKKLLDGSKSMIIRGAAGRKMPYGRVNTADMLYFMENDGSGDVRARAEVIEVLNSDKMTKEESAALVETHQESLQLTKEQQKRWAGKRYLVLITVSDVQSVDPFSVDRSGYGNMDDWLPVGDIENVRLP